MIEKQTTRELWGEQDLILGWLRRTTPSDTDERQRAWRGQLKEIGRELMRRTL